MHGTLPSFDQAPLLELITLDGNGLSGSVPNNLVSGSSSIHLFDLSNNRLTGPIPVSLNATVALELLLADNMINHIPNELCNNGDWMNGAVAKYQGCDAILCAPHSSSPDGRSVNDTAKCTPCSNTSNTSPYFGSISCQALVNEREILIELFNACHGPNWFRNDFWGSSADVCAWYGVGCKNGSVVLVNLYANNMQGTPPSSLFDLPNLEVLILGSNPINFQFINIAQASNLLEIRLDGTGLTSLKGISGAQSLTILDVGFNTLEGSLSDEIFQLPNLRVLILRNNHLSKIPVTWSSLKYLRILRLDNNRLSGPVPSFSGLSTLSYLFLGENFLTGPIPLNFLEHTTLSLNVTVDLSQNLITGMIPWQLTRFQNLNLFLRDNQITAIPEELCAQSAWNFGDVGWFGCDAILCRPGTTSPIGRHGSQFPAGCVACTDPTPEYFGNSTCLPQSAAGVVNRLLNSFLSMVVTLTLMWYV